MVRAPLELPWAKTPDKMKPLQTRTPPRRTASERQRAAHAAHAAARSPLPRLAAAVSPDLPAVRSGGGAVVDRTHEGEAPCSRGCTFPHVLEDPLAFVLYGYLLSARRAARTAAMSFCPLPNRNLAWSAGFELESPFFSGL